MKIYIGILVAALLLSSDILAHEDEPCTHTESERLEALLAVAGPIEALLQETEDRPFWVRSLSEEFAKNLPEPLARYGVLITYEDSYPGSKNELSTSCILVPGTCGSETSICSVDLDSKLSQCRTRRVTCEE